MTNSREPFISCPADGKVSRILSVPNEEASVNVGSVIQSGTNTEKCLLIEGCYGKAEYFISSLEKFSIYSVVCRSLRCMKWLFSWNVTCKKKKKKSKHSVLPMQV